MEEYLKSNLSEENYSKLEGDVEGMKLLYSGYGEYRDNRYIGDLVLPTISIDCYYDTFFKK